MRKTYNLAYWSHRKVGCNGYEHEILPTFGSLKYLSVKIEKQRTLCYTLYLH